ncbi:MAG: heparinase, partial [Muribaculaceae bacterium]|nr:heparinase [Muribaculaceae bacterium]
NLPVINGVEQPHGKKYKATDVKASKHRFEANIASAYPEKAEVKSWIRAYDVKNREVKITDRFVLEQVVSPNVINFLTWGDIDVSQPGCVAININGHKDLLTYDASRFDVTLTDKELPDPRLSNVWGPKITRISLTDKKPSAKGAYTYTIKAL